MLQGLTEFMGNSEKWADVIWALAGLLGYKTSGGVDDARVTVERLTRNVMLCPGTIEVFSQQMPVYFPPPAEEGLAPIDILYGCYIPKHLRIEIFVNRIQADAPRFKSHFLDLLTVVRIHEYAHAVVHAGINAADVVEQLRKLGAGAQQNGIPFGETAIERFPRLTTKAASS
jgi:hypothetical protein